MATKLPILILNTDFNSSFCVRHSSKRRGGQPSDVTRQQHGHRRDPLVRPPPASYVQWRDHNIAISLCVTTAMFSDMIIILRSL